MIDERLVILDSVLDNKESVIQFLSEKAQEFNYVNDLESYLNAVYKREAEFSTSIGYSVSIPHGKSLEVRQPFICFLRGRQPIQWDENGHLVKLVFLLGIPEAHKSTLHLRVLAEISKKLLDEAFRKQLMESDKAVIMNSLYQIEDKIMNL